MVKPQISKILICVVLLSVLMGSSMAVPEYTTLQPNEMIKNQTIPNQTEYKYYKFIVDGKQEGKDISILVSVEEEHPWANPDIFLSKTAVVPSELNAQIACKSYGDDICTINKNELKANETWYIGVKCTGANAISYKCVYDIVLEYVEELVLKVGVPITVYLYENEDRIFRYFVPDDPEIRHVQLSSRAKETFSKFQMLTVKGNDPPGTDRRRHSWPVWDNGYVSRFEPGCDCFCTNCNYTTMIHAVSAGYYTVTGKTSKVVEDISKGEIYDVVFRWRNNCYSYYVSDPKMDVRIKMRVYSGDPDIYVHPKVLPQMLTDFKYNSLESLESEELVITAKMREDDENVAGTYFICVHGKHSSSFKLEVRSDNKNNFMLESGVGESGYLNKGEIINYWYRDDILKEKTNITFQLHAMSGSMTLRSKFCSATSDLEKSKDECTHSQKDLTKPIANEKYFNTIGQKLISHDPETWNKKSGILDLFRKTYPSCIYNIGIIGTSEGKNHYGVTVKHTEGHHVMLFEGKTFEGSLKQGEYNYYKISISDDTISELTIQLLTVHGDPDLFTSQNDEFPTEEKFERKATIWGRFPDTIRYSIGVNGTEPVNLIGIYYVSVFGSQDSNYHLYYHTERTDKNQNGEVETVKLPLLLSQSKPVFGVLKSKTDYLLYKFNIANATNEEEIIVQLTPQNGKFNFTVKHNGEASLTDFDRMGSYDNHYTVVFNPVREPKYNKGEFNIYVAPVLTADMETSGMSFTFLINYYIGSHHIPLLDDQPTIGFIKENKLNYYTYLFKPNIDELRLTITKMSGNVDAVISLNQTVTFPTLADANENQGIYKTTTEKNTFSKTKLSTFCKQEQNYCSMVLAIAPSEIGKESQYVLTAKAIKLNSTPVSKIENGVPQHGSVNAKEWQYYYYKTSDSQPVFAVAVPNRGNPNLYVSIVSDLSLKENEWDLPTLESNFKKSEDSIGADILVMNKDDLKKCSSSWILIFGVNSNDYNSTYTLTVTRGLSMIKENVPFTDSLKVNGNYKFYEYFRSCSKCTTVISVSSLVNSAYNLFVNFNTTERVSSHKDRGTSDFTLTGRNNQNLIITPEDLVSKGYEDKAGYFFIEVHSQAQMNYTITVSSNEKALFPLSKGIPASFEVQNSSQDVYFSYLHDSSKGFVIQIQEEFGFVNALVNAVNDTQASELLKHLPVDQNSSTWSTYLSSNRNEIEIPSDDKKFCKKCTYVIRIESNSHSRGIITVQERGAQTAVNKITTLRLGYPVNVNMQFINFTHYKFILPDEMPLKVDLNVLSGQAEYEITTMKMSDELFGTELATGRNDTLIHYSNNTEDRFIFNKDHKSFKVGSLYYLTIKSISDYSRLVLTVSHVGLYSAISESSPQKVKIENTTSLFYYTMDNTPGKSKIVVEALPTNKDERYEVYCKIVSAKESIDPAKESKTPSWQLSPEEVILNKDHKIVFNGAKSKTFVSFDLNIVEGGDNQVILIAVKASSKTTLGSTVNLYVSSSNVQPLKLGVSHFGTVDNLEGVYKIYEVFIPKLTNETYVVELTPCYGKAEMFTARDFNRLKDKDYESKASKLANGRLYAVIKGFRHRATSHIIAVRSLNNATEEYKDYTFTEFQIEARKYSRADASDSYLEKYFIPNEGEIDWKISDDGDMLEITWSRIRDTEGLKEMPTEHTSYDIYISKEDKAGLESPCSITQFYTPVNSVSTSENTFKVSLENYYDSDDIYINVIGHVTDDSSSELTSYMDYPIAYRPLKVHMDNIDLSEGVDMFYLIVGFIIILALLCIIAWLYRRYRRVKHKLAEEVREVGHPEFGKEMNAVTVYNKFRGDPEATNTPDVE